jgi:broad specificity phosphatase PhoE
MLECFFVRHGITKENLDYTLIGRTDPPLHPLGRAQAEQLAKRFESVPFDAIFTSPLMRASETANVIAMMQRTRHVCFSGALRELNLGIVDGMSSFAAYEAYKDMMNQALDPSVDDFSFPEGESRLHGLRRFRRWLKTLAHVYPNRMVCIVTHGGILGLWLAHLEGLPLGQFRSRQPHHASVTRVSLTPYTARILSFDDTAHLTPELLSAIEKARNSRP